MSVSENMIRDSIRSRFSTILSEDNSDLEAILLVLQMIRTEQETQYREISQKLDHFLSIQPKPSGTTKAKKVKKNTNSAMEYFLATYAENQTKYNNMLEDTAIAALLDEYEDYQKDLEGDELVAKKAEIIWMHLAVKNEKFVEFIDEQIKNSADDDEKEVPAKKVATKKATKSTSTKKKASKPEDSDSIITEDTESVKAKKTAKKTTKKSTPVSEAADNIDQVSNLTEDIDDLDEDVESKPKKKVAGKKTTTKTTTTKKAKKPVVSDE